MAVGSGYRLAPVPVWEQKGNLVVLRGARPLGRLAIFLAPTGIPEPPPLFFAPCLHIKALHL